MPLSQEQFDALVSRLEAEAARHPAAYKFKLGAFASLGYLYVFGVLLALVATCVLLGLVIIETRGSVLIVFKYALIPLVVLIGLVLRSLWVRLDAPRGLALERRDHPALFAAIDEVRRSAKAPRADVVLLTNELNAAIVQVPRLGLFGWQKNYLVLGLPLMQIMSLDEFKAVLAHEFGHLSGAHGAFGAWIYRVRAGWARLHERLSVEQHWGSFMFVPFFGWYAPKFAAYSFVQARRQEYEADRLAAETFGAAPLADALVRLDLKGQELNRHYWPGIFADVDRSSTPTAAPFHGLSQPERRGFLPEASEWLSQSLERPTSTADTHPCLRDRIAAMRVPAALPAPVTESAAEALFGPKLADVVGKFDAEWRESVADWWHDRHAHVTNGREKLTAYRGRELTGLDDEALFEYARLAEEFDSADAALPLYEALARRDSRPVGGRFNLARISIDRDGASAVADLEALMGENPNLILPACDVIVGWLRRNGRDTESQPYIDRYWQRAAVENKQRAERETLRSNYGWFAPDLSADSLRRIREILSRHAEITAAYVVRKPFPPGEPPLHVLGIVRKSSWFRFEPDTKDGELVQKVAGALRIPEEALVLQLNRANKAFRKAFRKVPGSKVL